ncbi:hypothetical protein EVAR_67901_1 [Eumeta japonica]|uniref:Uncharacterized protein n=1 Tax=Eumeta variegata TaxID=151549 RepID=A0A4C1YSH6_EUMVA|nr:hypothetical protein EVAR_67901_1 [Eumeta japonica]
MDRRPGERRADNQNNNVMIGAGGVGARGGGGRRGPGGGGPSVFILNTRPAADCWKVLSPFASTKKYLTSISLTVRKELIDMSYPHTPRNDSNAPYEIVKFLNKRIKRSNCRPNGTSVQFDIKRNSRGQMHAYDFNKNVIITPIKALSWRAHGPSYIILARRARSRPPAAGSKHSTRAASDRDALGSCSDVRSISSDSISAIDDFYWTRTTRKSCPQSPLFLAPIK